MLRWVKVLLFLRHWAIGNTSLLLMVSCKMKFLSSVFCSALVSTPISRAQLNHLCNTMPESSRKSSEKLAAVERSIRALKHKLPLWLWLPSGLFATQKWLSNNCDVRCYRFMAKWVLLWLAYWGYRIESRWIFLGFFSCFFFGICFATWIFVWLFF